jgi:acyl carrier protein phosphodiesterase
MNYLAHAYLSFNHPEILVGNMISDFVKGKKKYDYPVAILEGINLHRDIDEFTDTHQATKAAVRILKPAAGPYAGAFVDIVYDHFLANDYRQFNNENDLQVFAANTYTTLTPFVPIMPERFATMFPYMQSQNWLFNYRLMSGTESSFGGLVRRAKYIDSSQETFQLFEKRYESLHECYQAFFPEVKVFVLSKFEEMGIDLSKT